MTPERANKLRYAGEGWSDNDIVIAADFLGRRVDRLTWGELRALLDAHGQTCEWVPYDPEYMSHWDTSCGRAWTFDEDGPVENGMHFCMGCGGRVVIRDGGTT